MATGVDKKSLLRLPAGERMELIDELWDSIVDEQGLAEFTPEQMREIHRRLEAFRANPDAAIPHTEFKRRLKHLTKPRS